MPSPKDPLRAIIIRNVPESVRRKLKAKAAKDGKSMQGVLLELIDMYVYDITGPEREWPVKTVGKRVGKVK